MRSIVITVLSSLFLALGLGSGAAEDKADVATVVKGDTEFALALYDRLHTDPGNLFLSPYSISTALAMTYAGARGDTAAQMAQTLHFPFGQDRLHPAFRALMQEINGAGQPRKYQLFVANALWGQQQDFLPAFLNVTRDNYGAGLRDVDFHNAEAARQTINRWIETQTHDKIKELLHSGDVDSRTKLVLTNTIYFKATWREPFPKSATRDEDFTVTADKKVSVPMMHQDGRFPYYDGGSYQALALPYDGDDMQMVVLLPTKADGLAELEKALTADMLGTCLAHLKPAETVVALPKFKVNARFQLGDTLAAMGMSAAFTGAADFSGMDGKKSLYLSKVIHQAFVDVYEQGTEAGAATAVTLKRLSIPTNQKHFRADHPFLFVIRDMRTGSLLFLGRVQNPQA